MKKLMILAGILTILFSYSCSNDFDLNEEWKDIPVVFGLLSRADTAHYIRVEKAFIDPTTSALEIAQRPDSIYYESIGVAVEHLNSGTIYQCERIDGRFEGFVRDEGIFAHEPNFLYKFKLGGNDKLIPGEVYQLKLSRGDNLPEVTAETIVVSDMNVAAPLTTIRFEGERSTNFRWNSGSDALFFDLTLGLNYLENSTDAPNTFEEKTIFWPVAKNIDKDDIQDLGEFKLEDGNTFFRFIASSFQDSGNLIRDFRNLDVIVTAGDQNLFDYINIGQANTGITSAQEIPSFTNLSEGIGLFGSTNTTIKSGITLTSATEDSLRFGQFTKDLNFQ